MKPENLIPHPEGGRFREVFRSSATVTNTEGQKRSALTHIYFSLKEGEVSHFHQVKSDEVWNLYQGSGIRLFLWDEKENHSSIVELSAERNQFCYVVPAGVWQAAEPIGASVLVGCSVGPGFEFDDFQMINSSSEVARTLLKSHSEWSEFIPNG